MNRIYLLLATLFLSTAATALPNYDVTVTFSPPITGGAPDGYNFYIDDCAVSGAIGAPVNTPFDPLVSGSGVVTGQTFLAELTLDGTYLMCVRAVNTAGENPDPGQVATVVVSDLPLPGPVNNLGIQVTCPTSNCTVNVTIN